MQPLKKISKGLAYSVHGDGPAVLLLHGFGEDGSVWDPVLNRLQGFRLVIPELPGNGNSRMLEDMSMEGLAKAVHDVVQLEKIEKVVMLGHSMGGYITLAFAALFPDVLHGFGLIHSTAYADNEEKRETRRKGIAFIKKNGGAAFLRMATPKLYSDETKEHQPDLIAQHIAVTERLEDAALVRYYESMIERPDRTEVLKEAAVPVLFVAGRWDSAIPVNDVLAQCHLPEVSYIHLLEKSGHMGMREEPEHMYAAIREFADHCFKHRI